MAVIWLQKRGKMPEPECNKKLCEQVHRANQHVNWIVKQLAGAVQKIGDRQPARPSLLLSVKQ
jgi:hypothetical protein